ncbi:hypothetical protein [Arcticibacter pallidicorallinus]|nr:hypothetical protein [Arcticibacter pallidicorallinus]
MMLQHGFTKNIKLAATLFMFFTAFILTSCDSKDKKIERPSFQPVLGMQFIEVRRAFDNGLAFNEYGFQQEPAWKLYFLSEDSVMIYSPFEKKYYHYPIYHDHDSVFNIAREWLRLKKLTKDSLTFQLLSVDRKEVSRERSNVTMKFYSHRYLSDVLKKDPVLLRRPNRNDTLFIKSLVSRANRNPKNPDSAFAARQPVQLISTIKEIEVVKEGLQYDPHNLLSISSADTYLKPEYSININKAYKDFSHTFTALVDQHGKLQVDTFWTSAEFTASRRKVLEGIVDVYLQRFLKVIPGSTLGLPHTSQITLYVKGKK